MLCAFGLIFNYSIRQMIIMNKLNEDFINNKVRLPKMNSCYRKHKLSFPGSLDKCIELLF